MSHLIKLLVAVTLFGTTAYAQEAGVLFSGTFLKEIGTRDAGVGTSAAGIGGRFVYRILPHLDLETDIIILPNNQASTETWIQGLLGAKAGHRFDRLGIFAKVRPGFMHFRKDRFGASNPGGGGSILGGRNFANSTEPSVDLGGVIEYYTARRLILRFDLGDTVLSYARRDVFLSQLLPPIERGGFTTHNWQGTFAFGFRF